MIWYVVFHPKGSRLWPGRYCHASLAGYDNETWVEIDLHRRGVVVKPIFAHDEVREYLAVLLSHYTVVKFGPSQGQGRHFLRPMTCVSFIKHTLGVRSRALLPDGLLHSLVRDHGAEVLNVSSRSAERNAVAGAAAARSRG